MKYLPLIWASFWRKRLRTIFTLASIVVAFLLFGLLQGIGATFEDAARKGHSDRLITNNIGFLPLPLASLQQIEALPGVSRVSYGSLMAGAHYQEEKNPVQVIAVDAKRWFPVYAEWQVPGGAVDELAHNRTGAIAGASLARKFGWKIGDRVPILSKSFKKDGSSDWAFDIVGIYNNPEFPAAEANFIVNYDYFDEARADTKGTVLQYEIIVADRRDAANLSAMVDGIFANSSSPTRTQSEREMIQSMLGQAGDVGFFVGILVFAVFFTLLFLTLNTMMQSVRERVPELAVLKTLGFTDRGVLALVLAESLLMSAIGAVLGLAAARTVFPALMPSFNGVQLSPSVIALGAVAALVLALISGLPSAWRANGLAIVAALAER